MQEKYVKLGDAAYEKYDFAAALTNYQQALKFGEKGYQNKLTNASSKIQQKQDRTLDRMK